MTLFRFLSLVLFSQMCYCTGTIILRRLLYSDSDSLSIEVIFFCKTDSCTSNGCNSVKDFIKVSRGIYQIYLYCTITELLEKIELVNKDVRSWRKGKTVLIFSGNSILESLDLVKLIALEYPNAFIRNSGLLFIFPIKKDNSAGDVCGVIGNNILSSSIKNITLASDVYFVSEDNNNEIIDFWEIYSIKDFPFCHKLEYPTNTKEKDLLTIIQGKLLRRNNFKRVEIIGGAVQDEKFEYAAKFGIGNITTFNSGVEVSMFRLIRDYLNFSEKATVTDTSRDAVIAGKVDISLTGSVGTAERTKSGTILQPTHTYFGIRAFITKPSFNTFRDIYASAFQYSVWLAMFSTWVAIVVALNLFVLIKKKMEDLDENDDEIFRDSILIAVASGLVHFPQQFFSQTGIYLCVYVRDSVFYSIQCSHRINFIGEKCPIQSFDDILKANYKLFIETVLQTSYVRLEENIVNRTKIKAVGDIIPEIERGGSAMISWPDVFYTFVRKSEKYQDKDVCNKFLDFPVIKTQLPRSMFMKSNSPFTESFNYVIIIMKERGLSFRPIIRYTRDFKVTCVDLNVVNFQDLSLNDVFTSFAILFLGYVTSIFILLLEMKCFVYKMKNAYLE